MEPITLKLPLNLRNSLQTPIGTFFKKTDKNKKPELEVIDLISKEKNLTFVVGDFVSKTLLENNFIPNLMIIDYKTHRDSNISLDLKKEFIIKKVDNQPGVIDKQAWDIIKKICSVFKNNLLDSHISSNKETKVIVVNGEEDLLVLPLILESPESTNILYGQPPYGNNGSEGIVLIKVNTKIKENIKELLNKFEIIKN